MTIQVLYSCHLCGLANMPVDVPERAVDEDVVVWMERTQVLTWRDHARRSPACHSRTLAELRIPMTGADRIGGPNLQ